MSNKMNTLNTLRKILIESLLEGINVEKVKSLPAAMQKKIKDRLVATARPPKRGGKDIKLRPRPDEEPGEEGRMGPKTFERVKGIRSKAGKALKDLEDK